MTDKKPESTRPMIKEGDLLIVDEQVRDAFIEAMTWQEAPLDDDYAEFGIVYVEHCHSVVGNTLVCFANFHRYVDRDLIEIVFQNTVSRDEVAIMSRDKVCPEDHLKALFKTMVLCGLVAGKSFQLTADQQQEHKGRQH